MITIGDIINGREPCIYKKYCLSDHVSEHCLFNSKEEALDYIKKNNMQNERWAEDYQELSEMRQFNEALRTSTSVYEAIDLVNNYLDIDYLELDIKNIVEEIQDYFRKSDFHFMYDLVYFGFKDLYFAYDKIGEIIKEDPCFIQFEVERNRITPFCFDVLADFIVADDNRTLLCYEYADKQLTAEMREKYPEIAAFIHNSIEQLKENLNRNNKEIEGDFHVR